MTCIHLQQLFKLCQEHDLKLSGSDLIRVVCRQCGEQEVCPSMLLDEYDTQGFVSVDETVAALKQRTVRCSRQE
jgi:hypothetical protein